MTLPPKHFLSLPRPGVTHLSSVPDMSTLAAHDFDIDVQTGFMPPQPPCSRLPQPWDPWEHALGDALMCRLKLGERGDLSEEDRTESAHWRQKLQKLPTLPTEGLTASETLLRRAHHVLTFVLHIYVHTLPPGSSAIHIPTSLSVPLLHVSSKLVLPPVLTYSDNVLYNWDLTTPQSPFSSSINPAHLRTQTTFTGTPSEEIFYLTSARIELAGVSALSLLRSMLHEAFVGDLLSLHQISQYLMELATVIDTMTTILIDVRHGCDPEVFYEEIRPWFRGQGSRPWIFDGVEAAGFAQPKELSGPSAGQSSIIHVLDIFLGIDEYSHSHVAGVSTSVPSPASQRSPEEMPFLERMQLYMPRHHRAFLNHLKVSPSPVRDIVAAANRSGSLQERGIRKGLTEAYNASVTAVKRFRDAHIRIATLYIVSQARRVHSVRDHEGVEQPSRERGTGGTDLVPFLKGIRDKTAAAILEDLN